MNVLIICPKRSTQNYETVIKSAPDIKILGAVNLVKSELIENIELKYNPHMIIYDTDVPTKKCEISNIINEIAEKHPHIPFIVFSDEKDNTEYHTPYIIKNQISSVEVVEIIEEAVKKYNNTYLMNKIKFNDNFKSTVIPPVRSTELPSSPTPAKTPKVEDKVDNLSTLSNTDNKSTNNSLPNQHQPFNLSQIKVKVKKRRTFKLDYKILIISAVAFLVALILVLVLLKSCDQNNNEVVSIGDEISSTVENSETVPSSEFFDEETSITPNADDVTIPTAAVATAKPNNDDKKSSSGDNVITSSNISSSIVNNQNNYSPNSNNNSNNNANNNNSNNNNSSYNKPASSITNSNSNNNSGSASIIYNDDTYNNNSQNSVSEVKLNYNQKTVAVGDTVRLQATITPSNITKTVSFSSSNSNIASVSSKGVVNARSAGTTYITATCQTKAATCKIIVKKIEQQQTEPNIYISPSSKTISINELVTINLLGATGEPTWKISDDSKVQVVLSSANIFAVRAKKTGTVTITATYKSKKYQCKLTIK